LKTTEAYGVEHFCTRCLPVRQGGDREKKDDPGLEGSVAKRTFFLIDKQGIVRGKWVGEDAVFSNEPLLKAAQEIAGKSAGAAGEKKPSAM
jgi:hypothetical protein